MSGLAGFASSLGDDLEFSMVFEAVDHVSSVVEGIGKALAGIITTTASFDQSLNQLQSNTTLTGAAMDDVRTAVLALNAQSGAPLDQLTTGMMRVADTGYTVGDSITILHAAMESALPTGADLGDVAGVLALQLHDFGMGAGMATEAMNVLHLASAESRSTLEDFSTSTAKATTTAANLGLPMTQVDAALAALTLHSGSAAQAATQLLGLFSKLIDPSVQAKAALTALGDKMGIDLVDDFTSVGLTAKGIPAVMADLAKATGNNVTEELKLVPALRGGLAEMVLLGTGNADYTRILKDLNAAMSGQTDVTFPAYQQYLHSITGEWAQLQAGATQATMVVGQPIVNGLIPVLGDLVAWETAHKPQIDAFGNAIGIDVATGIGKLATAVQTHQTEIQNFVKMFTGDLVTDLPLITGDFNSMATAIQGLGTKLDPVVSKLGTLISWYGTVSNLDMQANLKVAGAVGGAASFVGGVVHGGITDVTNLGLGALGLAGGVHNAYSTPDNQFAPFNTPLPGLGAGSAPPLSYNVPVPNVPPWWETKHAPPAPPNKPESQAQLDWENAQKAQHADAVAALAAQVAQVSQSHAQAALTTAQQRLQIDIMQKSPDSKLLTDINTVLHNFEAPILGNSPTAVQLEHLQLMQQIAKNSDDQVTLTTAQQQFQIDQLTNSPTATLAADIKNIMAAYSNPALDNTPTAIRLEALQLQAQLTKATPTTPVVPGPYASFAPFQTAGEGSTIAAFGSGQNATAQLIQHLQRLVASQAQEITLLQRIDDNTRETSKSGKGTAKSAATSADAGTQMLRETRKPKQAHSPFTGTGQTTSGRH